METLRILNQKIISCVQCPRLQRHCEKIAHDKRRQFQDEQYWAKPVPGFGDPKARVLVVGLAPAAHGANRTGRMFTGDNSGLWLYRALFRAGMANQAESSRKDDGLQLKGAFITAIARCAPPDNKPSPQEIESCAPYLREELRLLKEVRAYLVLGQVALKGLWRLLPDEVKPSRGVPKFAHGARILLRDGRLLLCSYHPSQQNTFTRKLTEPMFDSVFRELNEFLLTC